LINENHRAPLNKSRADKPDLLGENCGKKAFFVTKHSQDERETKAKQKSFEIGI